MTNILEGTFYGQADAVLRRATHPASPFIHLKTDGDPTVQAVQKTVDEAHNSALTALATYLQACQQLDGARETALRNQLEQRG